MQRCNSEFIFSISLTVILLNLYNANAIVSRKLLHKNGVKEFTVVKQIKGNECSCECVCVPYGNTDKGTEANDFLPPLKSSVEVPRPPHSKAPNYARYFNIVKDIRDNRCDCLCTCYGPPIFRIGNEVTAEKTMPPAEAQTSQSTPYFLNHQNFPSSTPSSTFSTTNSAATNTHQKITNFVEQSTSLSAKHDLLEMINAQKSTSMPSEIVPEKTAQTTTVVSEGNSFEKDTKSSIASSHSPQTSSKFNELTTEATRAISSGDIAGGESIDQNAREKPQNQITLIPLSIEEIKNDIQLSNDGKNEAQIITVNTLSTLKVAEKIRNEEESAKESVDRENIARHTETPQSSPTESNTHKISTEKQTLAAIQFNRTSPDFPTTPSVSPNLPPFTIANAETTMKIIDTEEINKSNNIEIEQKSSTFVAFSANSNWPFKEENDEGNEAARPTKIPVTKVPITTDHVFIQTSQDDKSNFINESKLPNKAIVETSKQPFSEAPTMSSTMAAKVSKTPESVTLSNSDGNNLKSSKPTKNGEDDDLSASRTSTESLPESSMQRTTANLNEIEMKTAQHTVIASTTISSTTNASIKSETDARSLTTQPLISTFTSVPSSEPSSTQINEVSLKVNVLSTLPAFSSTSSTAKNFETVDISSTGIHETPLIFSTPQTPSTTSAVPPKGSPSTSTEPPSLSTISIVTEALKSTTLLPSPVTETPSKEVDTDGGKKTLPPVFPITNGSTTPFLEPEQGVTESTALFQSINPEFRAKAANLLNRLKAQLYELRHAQMLRRKNESISTESIASTTAPSILTTNHLAETNSHKSTVGGENPTDKKDEKLMISSTTLTTPEIQITSTHQESTVIDRISDTTPTNGNRSGADEKINSKEELSLEGEEENDQWLLTPPPDLDPAAFRAKVANLLNRLKGQLEALRQVNLSKQSSSVDKNLIKESTKSGALPSITPSSSTSTTPIVGVEELDKSHRENERTTNLPQTKDENILGSSTLKNHNELLTITNSLPNTVSNKNEEKSANRSEESGRKNNANELKAEENEAKIDKNTRTEDKSVPTRTVSDVSTTTASSTAETTNLTNNDSVYNEKLAKAERLLTRLRAKLEELRRNKLIDGNEGKTAKETTETSALDKNMAVNVSDGSTNNFSNSAEIPSTSTLPATMFSQTIEQQLEKTTIMAVKDVNESTTTQQTIEKGKNKQEKEAILPLGPVGWAIRDKENVVNSVQAETATKAVETTTPNSSTIINKYEADETKLVKKTTPQAKFTKTIGTNEFSEDETHKALSKDQNETVKSSETREGINVKGSTLAITTTPTQKEEEGRESLIKDAFSTTVVIETIKDSTPKGVIKEPAAELPHFAITSKTEATTAIIAENDGNSMETNQSFSMFPFVTEEPANESDISIPATTTPTKLGMTLSTSAKGTNAFKTTTAESESLIPNLIEAIQNAITARPVYLATTAPPLTTTVRNSGPDEDFLPTTVAIANPASIPLILRLPPAPTLNTANAATNEATTTNEGKEESSTIYDDQTAEQRENFDMNLLNRLEQARRLREEQRLLELQERFVASAAPNEDEASSASPMLSVEQRAARRRVIEQRLAQLIQIERAHYEQLQRQQLEHTSTVTTTGVREKSFSKNEHDDSNRQTDDNQSSVQQQSKAEVIKEETDVNSSQTPSPDIPKKGKQPAYMETLRRLRKERCATIRRFLRSNLNSENVETDDRELNTTVALSWVDENCEAVVRRHFPRANCSQIHGIFRRCLLQPQSTKGGDLDHSKIAATKNDNDDGLEWFRARKRH